ncbi:iron dicitrate ABC transporter ATP-binding protein, partial [Streptomyces sp. NRRL F-6602]
GTPSEVLTEETVRAVFGLDSRIIEDPVSGRPLMLPIGRHHAAGAAGEAGKAVPARAARG